MRDKDLTVVGDLERDVVLHVADEHKETSLAAFYEGLGPAGCAGLELVCLDMGRPYIAATRRYVPHADAKPAFDKFHVARLLTDAVDRLRRWEHRALRTRGDTRLAGTRYWWLANPERMAEQRWRAFRAVRESTLKTARAWAIKELAMTLWGYVRRGWAEKAWKAWLAWALRCRLPAMRKVAETVRTYLMGDSQRHRRPAHERAGREPELPHPGAPAAGLRVPQP